MDIDRLAHDLALFYLQVELNEGQITAPREEDFSDFVNEYIYVRDSIEKQLKRHGY